MDRSALCDSLIIWMQTFGLNQSAHTAEDFSDGVLMSRVLNQIAPEYFSNYWLSKIKSDDVTNWRLKVSNLKKVINGIIDYKAEVLGYQIPEYHMPDVGKIGDSNDKTELSRMLQLILSCAVNCKEKQEYIQRIMNLEESVQHMVMTAIQELMLKETSTSSSSMEAVESEAQEQLKRLNDKLNSALQEKDELAQRCHELDFQVTSLQDDNSFLSAESLKLLANLEKNDNIDDPTTPAGRRIHQQSTLITTLQEEVYRLEAAKEDLRIKTEFLTNENGELQQKVSDLSHLAEQASHLKDEVDILRHTSEQVEKYETTIESYKRRFDELNMLKDQVKISEEKITVLLKEKVELQEELKKAGLLKDQLYGSKKQVLGLQSKLDEQTKIAERASMDAGTREQTIDTLRKEKERLLAERDNLKELNEELQCVQLSSNAGLDMSGDHIAASSPPSMDMLGVPLPIRQKLVRLEHEVKTMRPNAEKYDEVETERDLLKGMVEEATVKQRHVQHELETVSERLMSIEIDKADLENRLSERDEMIDKLQQRLRQTQDDMLLIEERYKKYLEKAKSLIRNLDPKLNPTISTDVAAYKSQVAEKDGLIQQLEKEFERMKNHKEQERKLMVSAWYNMGMQLHRKAVEERLSNSVAGQSFLARQRQAHTRRSLPPTPITPQQMSANK